VHQPILSSPAVLQLPGATQSADNGAPLTSPATAQVLGTGSGALHILDRNGAAGTLRAPKRLPPRSPSRSSPSSGTHCGWHSQQDNSNQIGRRSTEAVRLRRHIGRKENVLLNLLIGRAPTRAPLSGTHSASAAPDRAAPLTALPDLPIPPAWHSRSHSLTIPMLQATRAVVSRRTLRQ
jgi:hypothetical protein